MKRQIHSLCCVTLLVVLTIYPDSSPGQSKVSTQRRTLPDKILAFLRPEGEMSKYRATFAGEVIPIPEVLRKSLELTYYLHRFTIVRMKRSLGISYMYSELILVTDAKSGEVVSYLWELGLGGAPASFKQLLTHYPEDYDWRGVVFRIKVLSDLLVYPDRDYERLVGSRVGSIRYNGKEKMFSVELIRSYVPYYLLQVKVEEVGERYKFGRILFIDPESGKEK